MAPNSFIPLLRHNLIHCLFTPCVLKLVAISYIINNLRRRGINQRLKVDVTRPRVVYEHLCRADEEGVVKYDTGGVILTTHSLETVREEEEIIDHPCPPRTVNPKEMHGKAVVFYVPDIEVAVKELSDKGIRFTRGIARSGIGAIAEFEDPSRHVFYLYEPSPEALGKPSGSKLAKVLATQL